MVFDTGSLAVAIAEELFLCLIQVEIRVALSVLSAVPNITKVPYRFSVCYVFYTCFQHVSYSGGLYWSQPDSWVEMYCKKPSRWEEANVYETFRNIA